MKMIIFRFTVTGRGRFPLDMLRYDSCWPLTVDDSANLDGEYRNLREITMLGISYRGNHGYPTSDRWSSFGWSVDPKSIVIAG